jgi:hypothetical protein
MRAETVSASEADVIPAGEVLVGFFPVGVIAIPED